MFRGQTWNTCKGRGALTILLTRQSCAISGLCGAAAAGAQLSHPLIWCHQRVNDFTSCAASIVITSRKKCLGIKIVIFLSCTVQLELNNSTGFFRIWNFDSMHYHHNNSWLPVSLEKNYRKMVLALFLLWFKLFVLAWEKTEQKMYSPTSKRRIFLQEQAINKDINTKINQRKKCSCWIAKLRWTVKILWVSCETRLAAGMLIKNLKSWVGYIVKWEVGLGGGAQHKRRKKLQYENEVIWWMHRFEKNVCYFKQNLICILLVY